MTFSLLVESVLAEGDSGSVPAHFCLALSDLQVCSGQGSHDLPTLIALLCEAEQRERGYSSSPFLFAGLCGASGWHLRGAGRAGLCVLPVVAGTMERCGPLRARVEASSFRPTTSTSPSVLAACR